ncbi:MAG: thiamine pyrophosphate-dependent dehydrogenase E1 component subunit alpha [Chloroflexi bacterium]|nr:thiamine pyrophosphate-dependent dehydrogenase E1 component subunit alpha [Chloroflexota bacterium]
MATTAPSRHGALGLSDAQAVELFRLMLLTRRTSERAMILAKQGRVSIAVPSDGHEAAQVGAVAALGPLDTLFPYYRGLGAALARGYSVREVMLDHFGRADAPSSGGRQMPDHWSSPRLRLVTNSSSVGTHIPHAVGVALASQLRGEDAVAYASFGEGAVSKGDFHEGASFAVIHRLPVILVCENNRYSISVPLALESPLPSVADRAAGYGMTGVSVDGMDVLEVYRVVREARARAIRGDGPTLIEARVYRFGLHTSHVGIENYRSHDEIERERTHDPLRVYRDYLESVGLLDTRTVDALLTAIEAEVDAAVAAAEAAPVPAPDTATAQVYAS